MTLVKAKDHDSGETYYINLDHVLLVEDLVEYVEDETKQKLVYVDVFEKEVLDAVFGDMETSDIEKLISMVESVGDILLTNKLYSLLNGYRFYKT